MILLIIELIILLKKQLDIMKEIDAYKGLINNEKEKVRKRV